MLPVYPSRVGQTLHVREGSWSGPGAGGTVAGMDELLADVAVLGETPRILVACGFEGALAHLGEDRALPESSEALNVLLALPGTVVAVVSDRPPEEMSELMFLSGSKGGLRMIRPEDVGSLRVGVDSALVIDVDPASLEALRDGDLAVLVDADADRDADRDDRTDTGDGPHRVVDAEDVVVVLEELVGVRWRRLLVTGHATSGVPLSDPGAPPAPPRARSAGR
ncbi:hypothetical protein [Actinomycetospora sp. NBRC 106378]|uniref:hypothetical protein n=1 Tax=Actinomycetospora sp. NBRC 106378 TaxID=3032208 RepID=UPI0024A36D05|nr:hypothetical protein [Actinomycetospora sp. NBRC 106378]GLZ54574.1 hypothetical protein Acsp07_41910 [Actinomycetospora sp. NBRC 106378]